MAEMDSRFFEVALSNKYLTPKQMEICQELANEDLSSSEAAVQQKFMTAEQVAETFRTMSEEPVEVVQIDLNGPQREIDRKILDIVRQMKLVGEKELEVALREKKRLEKLGYHPQLASVLYSTNCLDRESLLALHTEIAGKEIELVEDSIAFADMGLPQVRQAIKKRRKKYKKKKAEETPPPAAAVEEAAEEEVWKPVSKSSESEELVAASQDSFQLVDDSESDEDTAVFEDEDFAASVEETELEDVDVMEQLQDAVPLDTETLTLMKQLLQRRSDDEAIEDKLDEVSSLQRELMQSVSQLESIAKAAASGSTPTAEAGEMGEYRDGLPVASSEEVRDVLENGGSLDGYYIEKLELSETKVEKNISFGQCLIAKAEMTDVAFQGKANFRGTRFVEKANFKGCRFEKEAIFREARFLNGADFSTVDFQHKANFNTAGFERFVSFNRASFGKKVIFTRSFFAKGVKFAEVEFAEGGSFNDMYVEHRFTMDKCKLQGESTFSGARFSEVSDFSRTRFAGEVKFKGTNFSKWASFKSVKFQADCTFNGMHISGDLSFDWSTFNGHVNMNAMCAERNVSLQSIKLGDDASFSILDAYLGRLFIAHRNLENRLASHRDHDYRTAQKEYGLLKNNFREINEYEKEDWAYLMEKRMERKAMKGITAMPKRFFSWTALDLACGYGTRPLNILMTAIVALLFFAGVYWLFPSEFVPLEDFAYPRKEAVVDGLDVSFNYIEATLVSFRTFSNASLGGWIPYVDSWINYVMMVESFLGFFTLTVLVVTFSRKVIR